MAGNSRLGSSSLLTQHGWVDRYALFAQIYILLALMVHGWQCANHFAAANLRTSLAVVLCAAFGSFANLAARTSVGVTSTRVFAAIAMTVVMVVFEVSARGR